MYEQLRAAFQWVDDAISDPAGWWRDPVLAAWIGTALAEPFRAADVTVVIGPESRGYLVGALVARELNAGFVEAYKYAGPSALVLTSGPLAVRKRLLTPADRVLAADDWLETGRQLDAVEAIVAAAGATYVGATVIAAAEPRPGVHSLIAVSDLDSAQHEREPVQRAAQN